MADIDAGVEIDPTMNQLTLPEARQALAGAIVDELTGQGAVGDTLTASDEYRRVASQEGFIAIKGWVYTTYGIAAIDVPATELCMEGIQTTDAVVSNEAAQLWKDIEGSLTDHGIEPPAVTSRRERLTNAILRRRRVPGYDPSHVAERWVEATPILVEREVSADQLGDIGFHAMGRGLIFTVQAQKETARQALQIAA